MNFQKWTKNDLEDANYANFRNQCIHFGKPLQPY